MKATGAYFGALCGKLHLSHLSIIARGWEIIEHSYAQKVYHNLSHIDAVLSHMAEVEDKISQEDYLYAQMAAFWHDYAPTEIESAAAADLFLRLGDADFDTVFWVSQFIRNTSEDSFGSLWGAGDYLRDADRAILGQPWEVYVKYAEGVRDEFASVPAEIFCAKRKQILSKMLRSEQIYRTEHFRDQYEAEARKNLAEEIQTLNLGKPL